MAVQEQEELMHAMKCYDFVEERGGRVLLSQIEGSPTEWESPVHAFDPVYRHEQKGTGLIHDLVNPAAEEKDHGVSIFLQWFVSEHVEEKASASVMVEKLRLMTDNPGSIFMFDRELAQATFTPPAAEEQQNSGRITKC